MKTQTTRQKRMLICGIAALLLAGVPAGICAQTENSNKKERKNMENVLTNRQRHMVTIANLEAKGDLERLAEAINEGLDDGLTVSEIREALSQLYAYTGFPRSLNALGTLQRVPDVLCRTVGKAEAHRAAEAIAEVLGEKDGCGAGGRGAGCDKPCGGAPVLDEVFAKGEPNTAYAKYFIGNSYLAPLASGEGKLGVANVTFEPRCRNNWHIHHRGGQILICVSGRGWYQEWGKPARELRPGDVVDIPAEAKHWHGAAADSWFQHIAIGVPADGAATEWLEAVEDAEYDKLN